MVLMIVRPECSYHCEHSGQFFTLMNLIGSKSLFHYLGYALICVKMFSYNSTDAVTCSLHCVRMCDIQ